MTHDPLIEAIENDMETGDHWGVVTLLRTGYQPTPQEWNAFRLAPMGSAAKAASVKRRAVLGRALVFYRAAPGTVEERKPTVMREFDLSEQEFHEYVERAGDKGARLYAKKVEKSDA
jgi:hypothetical protein